jgi:hypothetical protein
MANKKFLDYDGLSKFKSILDETYMKNDLNMELGDFSGTLEQILQGIITNISNNSSTINTHTSNTAIHVPTIENASYSNYILTRGKTNTTPSWSPGVVVPFESGTNKIFMNLTANSPTWENISTLVSKLPLAAGYVSLNDKNAVFSESQIGLVSTSYQSFSGEKQFNDGIRLLSGEDGCTLGHDQENGSGITLRSPEIYFGKNYNCKIYRGCYNDCIESGLTIANTHNSDGSINFITRDNKKWGILGEAPNGIPVFHNNLHINPDYNVNQTSYSSGICIYENKYFSEEYSGRCGGDRSQGFIGYNERTNINDVTAFAPFVMETDVSDIELITPGKINLKAPGGLLLNDDPISIGPASGWHTSEIDVGSDYIYYTPIEQTMSSGILTTEKQSIAGEKQFNDGIRLVNYILNCNGNYVMSGDTPNVERPNANIPEGHSEYSRIYFGPNNNTYIGPSHENWCSTNNFDFANNSFFEIKSPGFNNILKAGTFFEGGLSDLTEVKRTTFSPKNLVYTTIISAASNSNYAANFGRLLSSTGTTLLTMTSCSIGTMTPNSGQKTINLTSEGFIGGETLKFDLTSVRYSLALSCYGSSSSYITNLGYQINSGVFYTFTTIYYKFNTDSNWLKKSFAFTGNVPNQGFTSQKTGSTIITMTPDSASSPYFTIDIPENATMLYYWIVPFSVQENSLPLDPEVCNSINLYCINVKLTSSTYAYGTTYPYIFVSNSTSAGSRIIGAMNNGIINVTEQKTKLLFKSEDIENTIFGNGITCLTYDIAQDKTIFGERFTHDFYRSSIIVAEKSHDNKATKSAAFTVLDPNKLYLHSNIGETYISSIGLHRKHRSGSSQSLYNTRQDLYITVPGIGNANIIFGCNNNPDIIDSFVNEPTETSLKNTFWGGTTLKSASSDSGYIGDSGTRWYGIYSNYGDFSADVTISNKCSAKVFVQTSDEKLKNVKEEIQVDLERLKEIPKIYFNYKDDTVDDNKRIGTIAQDVQKIYPEIVHENEDGYLTIEYDKLSVIALKGIDELYENQKRLESEIKELKSLILKYIEQ